MSSDYQASVLYIKIARQHAAAQNIDLPDLLADSSLQQPAKQDLQDNKKLPLKTGS
ncbi:hypothetical protein [Alkalimarinus coralli]|uniref:hypothetical protein n=1 Tax=Alkalimarinus coralli TaxID=2935863 RepID=UPI00202B4955|nr:hypothetical protein [Alkalimarinus coralli]